MVTGIANTVYKLVSNHLNNKGLS